ncbi:hypothetical protein [Tolypothrix sp. VBCCA 56010]
MKECVSPDLIGEAKKDLALLILSIQQRYNTRNIAGKTNARFFSG